MKVKIVYEYENPKWKWIWVLLWPIKVVIISMAMNGIWNVALFPAVVEYVVYPYEIVLMVAPSIFMYDMLNRLRRTAE